jgi:hypothetical protein
MSVPHDCFITSTDSLATEIFVQFAREKKSGALNYSSVLNVSMANVSEIHSTYLKANAI